MEQVISSIDKNILGILITSLIAFLSWLIKGLIEKPLLSSKVIFFKFVERRIELLSSIKVRLTFIAYFPKESESKKFKEQIQNILLKDGKSAYLDSAMLQDVINISINLESDEKLILETINRIDIDLKSQIDKIQNSNIFFYKYNNIEPTRRILGYTLLFVRYILTIIFVVGGLLFLIYKLFIIQLIYKILLVLICTIILYIIDCWLTKRLNR